MIERITLSENEKLNLFSELVKRFDTNNSDIYSKGGQEIEFDLNETINVSAKLELYCESTKTDENNQSDINYQSVQKFKITLFNVEGTEVNSNVDSNFDDKISNYYSI